jgi:hypothetical protein
MKDLEMALLTLLSFLWFHTDRLAGRSFAVQHASVGDHIGGKAPSWRSGVGREPRAWPSRPRCMGGARSNDQRADRVEGERR